MSGSPLRTTANIGALVLAAGKGERMGSVKQLLPWKDSSLLEEKIRQVQNLKLKTVRVVLGAHSDLILNALLNSSRVEIDRADLVINPRWKTGMASSIASGLYDLLSSIPNLQAVLIVLSDQPLLDEKHFKSLINKYINSNYEIVSSLYSGSPGVPVIFDRTHFEALLRLQGKGGARRLLKDHLVHEQMVDVGDLGIDLDTSKEYDFYYKRYGSD